MSVLTAIGPIRRWYSLSLSVTLSPIHSLTHTHTHKTSIWILLCFRLAGECRAPYGSASDSSYQTMFFQTRQASSSMFCFTVFLALLLPIVIVVEQFREHRVQSFVVSVVSMSEKQVLCKLSKEEMLQVHLDSHADDMIYITGLDRREYIFRHQTHTLQ